MGTQGSSSEVCRAGTSRTLLELQPLTHQRYCSAGGNPRVEGEGWGERIFIPHPVLEDSLLTKEVGKQILPPCWSYGISPPEYSSLPCATGLPHSSPSCCCSQYWGERVRSLGIPPMPGTGEGAPLHKTSVPEVVSHVLMCQGLFPIRSPHLWFIPPVSPVSTGGLSEPQSSAPSPVFSGDVRGVAVSGTGA